MADIFFNRIRLDSVENLREVIVLTFDVLGNPVETPTLSKDVRFHIISSTISVLLYEFSIVGNIIQFTILLFNRCLLTSCSTCFIHRFGLVILSN